MSAAQSVYVVDACRTPIGRHRGALSDVRPDDLAGHGFVGPTVWTDDAGDFGLVLVVVRGARRLDASLGFAAAGVLRSALDGIPLLVRTLSLRAVPLTEGGRRTGAMVLAAMSARSSVSTFLAALLQR